MSRTKYWACIIAVIIGLVMFTAAIVLDHFYTPPKDLVEKCTLEAQHTEDGPVCKELHSLFYTIKKRAGDYAMVGLLFSLMFTFVAWYIDKRSLKNNGGKTASV